nr:DNA helicase [Tanacetum cinerariifolium]
MGRISDERLRDILDVPIKLFGGKTIMLEGDFRQTLPKEKSASRHEIINSSIAASYLWSLFRLFFLTENMRLTQGNLLKAEKVEVRAFVEWLLSVGDRVLDSIMRFGFSDRRLERTATFSISTNSEGGIVSSDVEFFVLEPPVRDTRSTSLFHLAEEDRRLGNLKFVPKGEEDEVFGMPIHNELILNNIRNAPYYSAYLKMVAKHNKKTAAEKEGKKKPTTAKQPKPKPAKEKSSKPTPTPKPKVTKENSTRPSPTKKTKMGKVTKVRNVKSSFQLVDEPDEEPAQLDPEPEPKYEEATRPHPVVEGKGKAIATEEQATQSLLALYTPKTRSTMDQFILQRRTPTMEETSTGPSLKPHNDASANIFHESSSPADAEIGADTDKTNSQAGSGPSKTLESRPQPEQEFIDEDQAGPDHRNLDDAYTIGDQFLNDKSTEDKPGKLNVDSKVVSMVTVLIHQASSLVSPLSTPIIYLSPPKPISSTTQALIFIEITMTTTTTLPLPPLPPQQSTSDFELAIHVTALKQKLVAFEQKSKTLDNTTRNLRSRVFTLELQDLPHKINQNILHQRMFENGSYKLLPEHVTLYEALEASMERANKNEFFTEKDKSRKRSRDDQDPPLPPSDSDPSKKSRHDSEKSSKPTPAPKPKVTKENSTRPSPMKKTKMGKVTKVRNVKSSFQLVDEPDEEPAQLDPEPEPKYEGEGED